MSLAYDFFQDYSNYQKVINQFGSGDGFREFAAKLGFLSSDINYFVHYGPFECCKKAFDKWLNASHSLDEFIQISISLKKITLLSSLGLSKPRSSELASQFLLQNLSLIKKEVSTDALFADFCFALNLGHKIESFSNRHTRVHDAISLWTGKMASSGTKEEFNNSLSTYSSLNDLVEKLFPSIDSKYSTGGSSKYSTGGSSKYSTELFTESNRKDEPDVPIG